jgi:hypothetical protein
MAKAKRDIDLEAEVARLSAIVDQLKGRLDGLDGASSNGHGPERPQSRRDLLKMAGAAAAGVAGGVLLGPVPAAAADGANVVLGNTSGTTVLNDAAHTTSLTATTTAGPTPLVKILGPGWTAPAAPPNGPNFQGALQVYSQPGIPASGTTPAKDAEAIDGWGPGGVGAGVIGASDTGYGVIGESGSGFDLTAFGTGRVFQISISDSGGNPLAGPPKWAPAIPPTFPGGELVRDMNSVLWASRATAPASPTTPPTYPKAWRRLNTVRLDSEDGSTFFQPVRIIDTRGTSPIGGIGGPRPAYSLTTWGPFPGTNGIPSDAVGIVGNVTVTGYTGQGFLAVIPAGANYDPNTSPSTMNYSTNWAWANAFTVGFGTGITGNAGKISVYVGGIPTHVIVDVVAYIQ